MQKLTGTAHRLWHAIRFLPKRIYRVGDHLVHGVTGIRRPGKRLLPVNRWLQWWLEFTFLLLDLLLLPELFETVADLVKWSSTRPLTPLELQEARTVFGNAIPYGRVRVDEKAVLACRTHGIFYVSFFTINAWGALQPGTFIHEMMHVWQYNRLGARYIPLALLAQRTPMGYNYGGVGALKLAMKNGCGLSHFNLEQQAEIVADYYCLAKGLPPRWTHADPASLPVFAYYIRLLRDGDSRTGTSASVEC